MDNQRLREAMHAPQPVRRAEILEVLHADTELTTILGGYTARKANVGLGWLFDQYAASVTTLHELGFSEHTPIPALEQVRTSIPRETAEWLNQRRESGHTDELVIVPPLKEIGLFGSKEQPGLIPQFDTIIPKRKAGSRYKLLHHQKHPKQSFVESTVTATASQRVAESITHTDCEQNGSVAILLGDCTDPTKPDKPVNSFGEQGLVYVNQTLPLQKLLFAHEQRTAGKQGRLLVEATIGQIVVMNAGRRLKGEPMLDSTSLTRLPQYPRRENGRKGTVLTASDFRNIFRLFYTSVDAWENAGIRRGLLVPTEAAAYKTHTP